MTTALDKTALMSRVEELLGEAEESGKQIAALRDSLQSCLPALPKWSLGYKKVNAVLTDTAQAAALYRRVSDYAR